MTMHAWVFGQSGRVQVEAEIHMQRGVGEMGNARERPADVHPVVATDDAAPCPSLPPAGPTQRHEMRRDRVVARWAAGRLPSPLRLPSMPWARLDAFPPMPRVYSDLALAPSESVFCRSYVWDMYTRVRT